MRILIADDQPQVRFALRVALELQSGPKTVSEVADGRDLLVEARCFCPDMLLLDLELPGLPASDLVRELRQLSQGLKLIVLSEKSELAQTALAIGADIFVSKADSPDRLLAAIREYWHRWQTEVQTTAPGQPSG